MPRFTFSSRLSLLLCLLLAHPFAVADAKLRVVTTFSILQDMVKQVGGDHVAVSSLVGVNADAHVFRPRPQDVREVSHADLVVLNGLGFEGWLDRLLQAAGFKGQKVVASSGVDTLTADGGYDHHDSDHGDHSAHEGEHRDESHPDPHAWHSLKNARLYLQNICEALTKSDPQHKADYLGNRDRLLAQVQELETEARKAIGNIPPQQRVIITAHDAFAYLARDLQLTLLAPQGTSTEADISAADLGKIIRQIRQTHARAIFFENIADNRVIRQVQQETGVKAGGELYSDALSGPTGDAPDYLGMMRHNIFSIINALQQR